MRKIILSALILGTSLFAEVKIPSELSDNDFEASEFQLFVTNTRKIPITEDMESKIVFEGDDNDYYEAVEIENEKKFKAVEEVAKSLTTMNKQLGNAVFYKDLQSLQNIGITTIGSIAVNAVVMALLGDNAYFQVQDFYKDGKPVTRVIKYLISDDSLDEEDYQLVFNTTNDETYHFRSGAIKTQKQRLF